MNCQGILFVIFVTLLILSIAAVYFDLYLPLLFTLVLLPQLATHLILRSCTYILCGTGIVVGELLPSCLH